MQQQTQSNSDPDASRLASGTSLLQYRRILTVIVVVAAAWRIALALLMPCISRDGSRFCWLARDLGGSGLALLKDPATEQHPFYPLLILGVQRVAAAIGVVESPVVWQRCGQFVALAAGLFVIVLSSAVARRLVGRLQLPLDPRRVALFAAALAAILPLNTWLSADAMSDEIHLAFYLAGVFCILRLDTIAASLACGVFGGLAFLTRPEGAMVAAAGVATAAAQLVARRHFAPVSRGTAVVLGFVICAAPLWTVTGKLTPKKDIFETPDANMAHQASATEYAAHAYASAGFATAANSSASHASTVQSATSLMPSLLAVLVTEKLPWYSIAPRALLELFRAGRVVVPLLALFPLLNLRRRLLTEPLIGMTICGGGHFLLTSMLLYKWGYLDPRHLLVIVMLLVPFAAMLLARLSDLVRDPRRIIPAPAIIGFLAVTFAIPGLYALRVPNGVDGYYRDAATWLRENDPHIRSKLLLCGSSPRRVAFYADMRLQQWPENDGAYDALADHIIKFKPDYFAIETAKGDEFRRHPELIERLKTDARIAPFLTIIHKESTERGDAVQLFGFAWSKE